MDLIEYLKERSQHSQLPPRIVLYGTAKIGKTTFAANAPAPVFIQTEDGLSGLSNVLAFDLCKDFTEVMTYLDWVHNSAHDLKSIVIDSVDWLEKLIFNQVAASHDKTFIGEIGFGKGYSEATDCMISVLNKLDAIRRDRKMLVIMLAHEDQKKFEDPLNDSYHRYSLKLHKSSAEKIQEWADIIAFAHQVVHLTEEKNGFNTRNRALGEGKRVLSLVEKAGFIAGNRYGLTSDISLSFEDFKTEFEAKTGRPLV